MKRLFYFFLLSISFSVSAQNRLVFTFDFEKTLNEKNNLCEPLEITGRKGTFKEISVANMRPNKRLAYEFATNSGLQLSKDAMNKLIFSSKSYSVEMFFRYDDGDLNIYKGILGDKAQSLTGKFIHLLFTRNDDTKQLIIYLNVEEVTNFVDANDDMALSQNTNMLFFQSNDPIRMPSSPGAVSRIRVYSDVMPKEEVEKLEGTITSSSSYTPSKNLLTTKITVKNIKFVQSKADPLPSSSDELADLAIVLKDNPNAEIELIGHTDNQGDFDLNLKLSQERVAYVKKYLLEKGINETRISGRGMGCLNPVASNWIEDTRKENRRVEVRIISR